MKIKIFFVSVFLYILMDSCLPDDDPAFGPSETGYPTTYFPLPAQKLLQDQYLYRSVNHPGLYTSLDTFGFISTNVQIYPNPVLPDYGVVTESKAKILAGRFVQRNSAFTGVVDTSLMKISKMQGMKRYQRPDFCQWIIIFENQQFNGLEVENTRMSFHLDSLGVYRAGGHWYPEILVPEHDHLTYEMAKKHIAGLKLTTWGWSGLIEHTINDNTSWRDDDIKKVIYPVELMERIELHVVWQLFPSIWRVLVDTSTGEVLHTEATVIF